jgi:hypothetical protein
MRDTVAQVAAFASERFPFRRVADGTPQLRLMETSTGRSFFPTTWDVELGACGLEKRCVLVAEALT